MDSHDITHENASVVHVDIESNENIICLLIN